MPPKEKGIKITVSKKEEQEPKVEFKNSEVGANVGTDQAEDFDNFVDLRGEQATGDTDGTDKKEKVVGTEVVSDDT